MAKRKRNKMKPEIKPIQVDFLELESGPTNSEKKITIRRDGSKVVVSVPVRFCRRNGRQMILADEVDTASPESYSRNNVVVCALAKAWFWQDQLESGQFKSVEEIAQANKVDRTYISRILQLTSLSPTVVEEILAGEEPHGISLRQLRKGVPVVWQEQRQRIRVPSSFPKDNTLITECD